VCRAACSGNNHFQAAILGSFGITKEQVRRAVGRNNLRLKRHFQAFERLDRVAHGFPVRPGPHDNSDEWLHRSRVSSSYTVTCAVCVYRSIVGSAQTVK
jgi:hypothetical protein